MDLIWASPELKACTRVKIEAVECYNDSGTAL